MNIKMPRGAWSGFAGKKITLLLLSLTFTAVSCNQLLSGGSGVEGVLQSTDLGDSFHDINKIDKKTNLNSTSVNVLAFDPSNSQVMYLGSSAGIYRTDNIGNEWKLLVTNILITDLSIDPASPNTMYAVGLSEKHGKIIKTTDTGASWKDLYTEPTSNNAVVSVAVDPKDHVTVLAGLQTGDIIKSADAGLTWKAVAKLDDRVLKIRFGPNGNSYILTQHNGMYESRDNSNTFANISDTLTNGLTNFGSNYSAVTSFLDLAFDIRQSGVIYLGTQEGLLRTVDDGANWSYLTMPVRNSMLRTSSVAVNPKDSNNLFATVGNTLFKSNNGGISWQTKPMPTGQEVRQILIDPTAVNVLYLGLGVRK